MTMCREDSPPNKTYLNTVKVICQIGEARFQGLSHAFDLKIGAFVVLESVGDEGFVEVGSLITASHAQVVGIDHVNDKVFADGQLLQFVQRHLAVGFVELADHV